MQQFADSVGVGLNSDDAIIGKAVAGIGTADGLQDIKNNHGLEDIQFKMPVAARNGNGHMVAHDLRAGPWSWLQIDPSLQ